MNAIMRAAPRRGNALAYNVQGQCSSLWRDAEESNLTMPQALTTLILVHVLLITSVHCIESLVWLEVSGFCCIINSGPSLGLLLDNLLFYVTETL